MAVTTNPLLHFKKCHLLFPIPAIPGDPSHEERHSQQTKHYTRQEGAGFQLTISKMFTYQRWQHHHIIKMEKQIPFEN